MLDPRTQTVLQDFFCRESRSLLQYAHDSVPWTSFAHRDALGRLRRVIVDERSAIAEVARFLLRCHAPLPVAGAYPSEFTSVNDIGLDYLARLLVQRQRQAIASLERDLVQVADPEAKALLERALTAKRDHLATLEALATPASATAPH